MFVLDTNIVAELRRPAKADREVVRWAQSLPVSSFFLSSITVLELELGILLIARKDPVQGATLRGWVDQQVLLQFDHRILAVDTTIARRCAQLHVPDRRAERDSLIAATALVHGMTVATHNTADFEPMGVPVFNPWMRAATR